MAGLISAQPRIRRCHSGCKSCRRRGKKCDETKPACKACVRLKLDCVYGTDWVFRNVDNLSLDRASAPKTASGKPCQSRLVAVTCETDNAVVRVTNSRIEKPQPARLCIGASLRTTFDTDSIYFNHFDRWVRADLMDWPDDMFNEVFSSATVKHAILCLSASHLAVLDGKVIERKMKDSHSWPTRSIAFNPHHYKQSQHYLVYTIKQLYSSNDNDDSEIDTISALTARTLLAYYHHAATTHFQFRSSVLESFDFVRRHHKVFSTSVRARLVLQFWYRLIGSSKLSKPPGLPLEGEYQNQESRISCSPVVDECIFSLCHLGMSSDDLIYNIMIKMMELRSRAVINSCTAHLFAVSETSQDINRLAHLALKQSLNKHAGKGLQQEDGDVSAQSSFVSGLHLFELMKIQEQRLQVWRSTLSAEQMPLIFQAQKSSSLSYTQSQMKCTGELRFTSHRNAMNYLYYLLCSIMFAEMTEMGTQSWTDLGNWHTQSRVGVVELIQDFFNIVDHLDYNQSNLCDVYRFSLVEVLRQFIYSCRSSEIFHHVLEVTWPKINEHGKGVEHSHLPTQLARRLISRMAAEYVEGRHVLLTFNAVPETISKSVMMNSCEKIAVVLCGISETGTFFLERRQLV